MIAVNGRLQLGHLLRRHIAGDIAPVLIALMVVVGALRALADDADGAALQLLDLGDVMEDRLRGGLVIHEPKYMCNTYTEATKKGAKTQFEEICLTPNSSPQSPPEGGFGSDTGSDGRDGALRRPRRRARASGDG